MLRAFSQRLLPSWRCPPAVDGTLSALAPQSVPRRWATKKAGGTVKNSKDSHPKYLGVKKFGGEWCKPGNIIIRQRGEKYRPGEYVGLGRDFTIWALVEGQVKFWKERLWNPRTGLVRRKTCVSVVPGTKPVKPVKPPPPWFQCVRRKRRKEREKRLRPLKERNRLFLYEKPEATILPAPLMA